MEVPWCDHALASRGPLPLSLIVGSMGRLERARAAAVCPEWRAEVRFQDAKAPPPRFLGPVAAEEARAVRWSPRDDWVAVGAAATVRLLSAATGREAPLAAPPIAQRFVSSVAFSRDGAVVAACSATAVTAWEAAEGGACLFSVHLPPEGPRRNAGKCDFGTVRSRLFATPRHLWRLRKEGDGMDAVRAFGGGFCDGVGCRFSPDGARIAVGGRDRRARVVDVETGQAVADLPIDADDAAWSPDGGRLLTVSGGSALTWDVRGGGGGGILNARFKDYPPGLGGACACEWSRDGRVIVTWRGTEKRFTLWTPEGAALAELDYDCAGDLPSTPDDAALALRGASRYDRMYAECASFSPDSASLVALYSDAWRCHNMATFVDMDDHR